MESSREDQIMELFNELLLSYHFTFQGNIMNSGENVDNRMASLEKAIDEWLAEMNSLVYGKDKD